MNERVKELRKALNLSQEVFGKKIGVTKSTISNIETKRFNLTESLIRLICKEFNVSYAWLVDGEGDIFINIPDTLIDEIAIDYNLDEDAKLLVKTFLELNQEDRKGVCTYINNLVSNFNNLKK